MPRPGSGLGIADLAVATLTAAGLAALAFSGGSFDAVPRHTGGVVVWWAVALFAVVAVRLPPRPRAVGLAVTGFAAGIAVWVALGASASISAERSANELARSVVHLGPIVLVGWVLPRRRWRAVVGGVALGLVVVCAAALAERLSPGFLTDTRTVVFENTASRLAAPLGYWNALGSWGVMAALLLVAIASHAHRVAWRAVALACVSIVVAVVFVTYSRSALAAGVLGAVVLVALARNRWTTAANLGATCGAAAAVAASIRAQSAIANAESGDGAAAVVATIAVTAALLAVVAVATRRLDAVRLQMRTARVVAASTALAVGFAGVGVVVAQGEQVWDRFSTTESAADTADPTNRLTMINNGSRVAQWRVALDSWEQSRWTGSGAGTFEFTYNRESTDTQFVRDAHSSLLEALSEQGLIGFGLLLGFMVSALASAAVAVRRLTEPTDRGLVAGATAAVVAFFLGSSADWFLEVTALAMVAMTLIGALVAAASDQSSELTGSPRRHGIWLRLGLVATASVAILTLLPGLVGTSEIRRSETAVQRNDLIDARAHADRAIDTMPWASSPFLHRGLVDESAGAWDSARKSLVLAIERDPYDWRLPLVLSRIEAQAGDPEAALEAYRDAKALRPRGQFFR